MKRTSFLMPVLVLLLGCTLATACKPDKGDEEEAEKEVDLEGEVSSYFLDLANAMIAAIQGQEYDKERFPGLDEQVTEKMKTSLSELGDSPKLVLIQVRELETTFDRGSAPKPRLKRADMYVLPDESLRFGFLVWDESNGEYPEKLQEQLDKYDGVLTQSVEVLIQAFEGDCSPALLHVDDAPEWVYANNSWISPSRGNRKDSVDFQCKKYQHIIDAGVELQPSPGNTYLSIFLEGNDKRASLNGSLLPRDGKLKPRIKGVKLYTD